MRTLKLKDKYHLKFDTDVLQLSENEIEGTLKSFRPGEWCSVEHQGKKYLGFVNPNSKRKQNICVYHGNNIEPLELIKKNISHAISYRASIGYGTNSRLIYGVEDGLPGLILDSYQNCAILQINTAGIDLYRNEIKDYIQSKIDQDVLFLDHKAYRDMEELPLFENDQLPEEIEILESGLQYRINKQLMQKVGYYYDHRENRCKFEELIKRLSIKPKSGLDLFTYVGSWGLHLLRAGVESVEFVDQANMEEVLNKHLEINHFSNRGKFTRADVFKFLDEKVNDDQKYDVIVCDPPAFSKNIKDKKAAIKGYEKLYMRIFKMMDSGGLLAAASCTQNISIAELDDCVNKAALKNGVRIRLVDTGIQGLDHPIRNLESKSNYIKYLAYKVENND